VARTKRQNKKTIDDYQIEIKHALLKCPVVDFRKDEGLDRGKEIH
jgi:hypothetical protein